MTITSDVRFARKYGPLTARTLASNVVREAKHRKRPRPVPPNIELTDFDPFDHATAADPYPRYRQLLAGGPVHYNPDRSIFILTPLRRRPSRRARRPRAVKRRRSHLRPHEVADIADHRCATTYPHAQAGLAGLHPRRARVVATDGRPLGADAGRRSDRPVACRGGLHPRRADAHGDDRAHPRYRRRRPSGLPTVVERHGTGRRRKHFEIRPA